MKALSFKVPKTKNESVRVQVDYQPYFYDSFHYHPEVQISYILKGTGTRIIGNSVGRFSEDELYLIGPNIPHIFKSDKDYYEDNTLFSHAISFYFTRDSLGKDFFNTPELSEINNLLKSTSKIVLLKNDDMKFLKESFTNIVDAKGFEKLHQFLSVLNKISNIKNRVHLSKTAYELKN